MPWKEAASPPLIFRARRAGYGAAPPASRALRVSCGNGLRPPWTPETSAAPEAGRAVRPRACPARRAARRAVLADGCGDPDAREQGELAFDNQKGKGKITQIQVRAPGPVASSQQSHLAKLRHTEPGVHETRDTPRLYRAWGIVRPGSGLPWPW